VGRSGRGGGGEVNVNTRGWARGNTPGTRHELDQGATFKL
jgi:hypothetical protein